MLIRSKRFPHCYFPTSLSVILSVLLNACGPAGSSAALLNPSQTSCGPNAAEILVGDTYLETLCGCAHPSEADGTLFPVPGNLTCHLAPGRNTVFFFFIGTQLRHQIVPQGSSLFASSPISDQSSSIPIRAHAVTFSASGTTYPFKDIFSGMTGQIITP